MWSSAAHNKTGTRREKKRRPRRSNHDASRRVARRVDWPATKTRSHSILAATGLVPVERRLARYEDTAAQHTRRHWACPSGASTGPLRRHGRTAYSPPLGLSQWSVDWPATKTRSHGILAATGLVPVERRLARYEDTVARHTRRHWACPSGASTGPLRRHGRTAYSPPLGLSQWSVDWPATKTRSHGILAATGLGPRYSRHPARTSSVGAVVSAGGLPGSDIQHS